MVVTLLYFDGRRNRQLAEERLREALARSGRTDVRQERRQVVTPAEAFAFRGSPTVLVNGRDPFADPDAPVALSCRVHHTATGLAGAPTVEQLLAVLR